MVIVCCLFQQQVVYLMIHTRNSLKQILVYPSELIILMIWSLQLSRQFLSLTLTLFLLTRLKTLSMLSLECGAKFGNWKKPFIFAVWYHIVSILYFLKSHIPLLFHHLLNQGKQFRLFQAFKLNNFLIYIFNFIIIKP